MDDSRRPWIVNVSCVHMDHHNALGRWTDGVYLNSGIPWTVWFWYVGYFFHTK